MEKGKLTRPEKGKSMIFVVMSIFVLRTVTPVT